jgi:hypothetical protein
MERGLGADRARTRESLLDHLAILTRNQVRFPGASTDVPMLAEATPDQRPAFELIGTPRFQVIGAHTCSAPRSASSTAQMHEHSPGLLFGLPSRAVNTVIPGIYPRLSFRTGGAKAAQVKVHILAHAASFPGW